MENETLPTATKYYEYMELNPFSAKHSTGLAQIVRFNEEKEYMTYRNEQTGNRILVSQLGGAKYECLGSCLCTTESSRRFSSIVTLSGGLFLLFSAFSVASAMEIAEKSFLDGCVKKYSKVCDTPDIKSEVKSCYESSPDDHQSTEDGSGLKRYFCRGECIENLAVIENVGLQVYARIKGLFGICEKNQITRTVDIDCDSFSKKCQRAAKEEFSTEHLHPFCVQETLLPLLELSLPQEQIDSVPMSLCSSHPQVSGNYDHITCLGSV